MWGNALKPVGMQTSEHAFVKKSLNETNSREVFQIPILRPVVARLPSHSIACSLLPFTVLKLAVAGALSAVACADCMQPITVYGIETR